MIDATKLNAYSLCDVTYKSCVDLNTYQYESPLIPDKEWAVAVQEVPQDLNSILGASMRFINVTLKHHFKEYKLGYDRWTVQTNLARSLELERECYNEAATFLIPARRRRLVNISQYIILNILRESTRQISEPHQKFVPSQRLIDVVYKNMVCPHDEEILSLLLEMGDKDIDIAGEKQNVRGMITDQVEGLFVNLAKRAFYTAEEIIIANNNRFTPEVCRELIDRLGIDPLEPRPVLELLHGELFAFISQIPRERVWGNIFAENSEIKLEVKQDAFILPEFPSINDETWLVT